MQEQTQLGAGLGRDQMDPNKIIEALRVVLEREGVLLPRSAVGETRDDHRVDEVVGAVSENRPVLDAVQRRCVDMLLDPANSLSLKAVCLAKHIAKFDRHIDDCAAHTVYFFSSSPDKMKEYRRRRVKIRREWRASELETFIDSLPAEPAGQLCLVLAAVEAHEREERREYQNMRRHLAEQLRDLPIGSALLVEIGDVMDVVYLIEVKRTRFLCEHTDGRRRILSSEAFRGVYSGEISPRLTDEERARTETIRVLGGTGFRVTKSLLVGRAGEFLPDLFRELAAARARVDDAPVSPNTHDEALVKRIPLVLAEIVRVKGKENVLDCLVDYAAEAPEQAGQLLADLAALEALMDLGDGVR